MTVKLSSLVLGAAVVALSGVAAYLGARLAQPDSAREPGGDDGEIADVVTHLEEHERRLDNAERRLGTVEEIATSARDLAEALRDQRMTGVAPVAPAAARDGATPAADAKTGPEGVQRAAEPARSLTEDELRAERAQKIRDTVRSNLVRDVPGLLASYGDTKPGAAERRRQLASIEARQLAVSLAVTPEQADQLDTLLEDQAARLASEVGPLVRDGFDRADPAAVEAGLTRVWDEMDRRAKEILGDQGFTSFDDHTKFLRTVIRDVLADAKKRR